MRKKEEYNYNEDMFRLALRNTIYHSINDVVWEEVNCRLPTLYMFYIEGKVNNEDIQNYINCNGDIW